MALKGRLQNDDHKSESELIAEGANKSKLLNDNKIYLASLDSKFSSALEAGSVANSEAATLMKQLSTPSNPASNYMKLYFKSDGKLYKLNSSGVEAEIGSGGGGITRIANGGTLSGEYWGDVICEGNATLNGNATIHGSLYIIGNFSTNGEFDLNVEGNLIGPNTTMSLNTSTAGTRGGDLTVYGDCVLSAFFSNGQNANDWVNAGRGGNVLICGNYFFATSHETKGGSCTGFFSRRAGDGGSLTVYGQVFSYGNIRCSGGSVSASIGDAGGNGGSITLGSFSYTNGNIISVGGSTNSTFANGGRGGDITIQQNITCAELISRGGGCTNSSAAGNGGRGGDIIVNGNCLCNNVYLSGGDTSLGSGGNSGTFVVRGNLCIKTISIIYANGGNVNGGGSTGSPANGGEVYVYGFCSGDNAAIQAMGGSRFTGSNSINGGHGGVVRLYGGANNIGVNVNGGSTNNGTAGGCGEGTFHNSYLRYLYANDGSPGSTPSKTSTFFLRGYVTIGEMQVANRSTQVRIKPEAINSSVIFKVGDLTGLDKLSTVANVLTGSIDSSYIYVETSTGTWLRIGPGGSF